jgi:hypothetical protein
VTLSRATRSLPPRSTAGQLTLDQHIGVRIPGGQPIAQATSRDPSSRALPSQQRLSDQIPLCGPCLSSFGIALRSMQSGHLNGQETCLNSLGFPKKSSGRIDANSTSVLTREHPGATMSCCRCTIAAPIQEELSTAYRFLSAMLRTKSRSPFRFVENSYLSGTPPHKRAIFAVKLNLHQIEPTVKSS